MLQRSYKNLTASEILPVYSPPWVYGSISLVLMSMALIKSERLQRPFFDAYRRFDRLQ